MGKSFLGKILHIDLSSNQCYEEHPDEVFYRTYGGGSAMGLYYILKEMPKGVDALSAGNILTLFTGVPTGLPIPGQSRLVANARSPLTGAIGDSQCGGFFPAALKAAGYDGIVLKGRAPEPVFIYINEGTFEIRPAQHLWGKTTGEVEDLLKSEIPGKMEVLQIGPAGEKLVRFASIINMRSRANGRTGMGAVMGSKNLKAIVVQGNGRVDAYDKTSIGQLSRFGTASIDTILDVKGLKVNGTGDVVPFQNSIGSLPTRNYTEGQFESFEDITGERMTATILKSRETCFACTVQCKRAVEAEEVEPRYGGPEYETLATFGSYCGINDLKSIARANQICNQYGMDTISCGATIAFAMECFEKGLLSKEKTGGLDLHFGNADAMLTLLLQIGNRQGLGEILGEGSQRAAVHIGKGAEKLLITYKGQEAPAHMPQAKRSLGLIYAVNPFGADHQSSEHDPMYEEGGAQLYFDRLALLGLKEPQAPGSMTEEKIRFAYISEVFYSALDSYALCQFVWGPAWTLYGPAEMVEMLHAATGWDITVEEILKVGERRLNMLRAFNAREGMDRKDDDMPLKLQEPLKGTGPTVGVSIYAAELEEWKDVYYHLAGWNQHTGNPTQEKLAALGLEWVNI